MKSLTLLVILLIAARATLEKPLTLLQPYMGDMGLGAAFNAFMILAGATYLVVDGVRAPALSLGLWGAFLLVCALFSMGSPEPFAVVRILLVMTTYACAVMIPYHLVRTGRDLMVVVDVILLSSLVPALFAIGEIASGLGDPELRVQGTLTHPNIYAFYILITLAAIVLRFRDESTSSRRRIALVVLALLHGLLLLLTGTRSAWIGAGILLGAYALLIDRRQLILLAAVPVVALMVPSVRDRLLEATASADYIGSGVVLSSYEWRLTLWRDAFLWIERNPWTGHGGLHSFFYHSGDFFKFIPVATEGVNAHSVFVMLLFEVGVLGPLLFIAILLRDTLSCLAGWSRDRLLAVVGASLVVTYALLCYSDNVLDYLTFNWYFWFLLGAIGARLRFLRAGAPAQATAVDGRPRHVLS